MRLAAYTMSLLVLHAAASAQWSLDSQGWTLVQASAGASPASPATFIVYVSSSGGDDNYDGLSPVHIINTSQGPKATIQAGYNLLHDGANDQLLLRAGDIWTFWLPAGQVTVSWEKSGASSASPMVFGSYMTVAQQGQSPPPPRPAIYSNVTAFYSNKFSAPTGVRYLLITGIDFERRIETPPDPNARGISFVAGPTQWVRIEDCFIRFWYQGIAISKDPNNPTRSDNLSVRRCVMVDNYDVFNQLPPATANTTGLFVESTDTLLVEECVFDQNGWDGANYWTRNDQNHNNYIQDDCTNVTVTGNISARGSADNYQLRSIGTITYNLSLRTPIHFSIGGTLDPVNNPRPPHFADIHHNVALEGDDIDPGDPSAQMGWGYHVQNVGGLQVSSMRHNIASQKGDGGQQPLAIFIDAATLDPLHNVGVKSLDVHDNMVYKWGGPLCMDSALDNTGQPLMSAVRVFNNDIQSTGQDLAFEAPVRQPSFPGGGSWNSWQNKLWTAKLTPPVGGIPDFMRWLGNDYVVDNPPSSGWRQVIQPAGTDGLPFGQPSTATHVVSYPHPERTIVTYHQSLPWSGGSGGLAEFMAECRQQRKDYWRPELVGTQAVQYFQLGFWQTVP